MRLTARSRTLLDRQDCPLPLIALLPSASLQHRSRCTTKGLQEGIDLHKVCKPQRRHVADSAVDNGFFIATALAVNVEMTQSPLNGDLVVKHLYCGL